MAHPMAGQAKASQKARLGRLGASAGKSWGSANMYKKTSYPGKQAGSSTPMTIGGGKSKKRADRKAQRLAGGGRVKGKKPGHTTNIVISAPGGAGGRGLGPGMGGGLGGAMPMRRPMPVPVPVGGGAAAGPAPPALPPPPMGAAPPVAPVGAVARPPLPPVGARPMGAGMKKGGAVKRANGGNAGRAYRGFPNSPTTDVDSAVSAHKKGGKAGYQYGGEVKKKKDDDDKEDDGAALDEFSGMGGDGVVSGGDGGPPAAADVAAENMPPPQEEKRGGRVKKRQGGGLLGPAPGQRPTPAVQGPPTISGRKARPALPLTVPLPNTLAARRTRPAPGTQVGFKKGGRAAHGDEAEDRKLFRKMMKEEKRT